MELATPARRKETTGVHESKKIERKPGRAPTNCGLCKNPKNTGPDDEWIDFRRGQTLVICMSCANAIAAVAGR